MAPEVVFAARRKTQAGLGDLASNMLVPAMGIRDLIHVVCLLTATGLLIGSFILFIQHRRNPIEVPMSKPFTMIFVAIALILLTFIPIGF